MIRRLGLFYAVQTGMDIDKKSPEALRYLTSLLSTLEDVNLSNFSFLVYKNLKKNVTIDKVTIDEEEIKWARGDYAGFDCSSPYRKFCDEAVRLC